MRTVRKNSREVYLCMYPLSMSSMSLPTQSISTVIRDAFTQWTTRDTQNTLCSRVAMLLCAKDN